jgi:hypothetical protein
MARPQTIKQHQAIKAEFERLSNIREYGVAKHSMEWIFNKLADQFFKSPKTIENIVFNRTATSISKKESTPDLFS